MFLHKKHRREVIQLNVIPLIDISSMIIIFLIMGTIFGESSVTIPPNLVLPKSESKDTVDNALQIVITEQEVYTKFLDNKTPTHIFHNYGNEVSNFAKQVKSYVDNLPKEAKKSELLLNVVADAGVSYRTIFNVTKVFRNSGFSSILFVTIGENVGK